MHHIVLNMTRRQRRKLNSEASGRSGGRNIPRISRWTNSCHIYCVIYTLTCKTKRRAKLSWIKLNQRVFQSHRMHFPYAFTFDLFLSFEQTP